MSKNILNWFAVLAFAGLLSACGQNADQGDAAAPTEQPAAPAEVPATPADH